MHTQEPNSFHFAHAQRGAGMTVLNAVMSDFSYANHAHEEFALGVTQEGVQEFTCNGRSFRSFPGNVILFNPGDVHNGNPGKGSALKYTMLYLDPEVFYPLLSSAARPGETAFYVPETLLDDGVLRALVLNLSRMVTRGGPSSLECEGCLFETARRLTRRMGIHSPDAFTGRKDSLFATVRDYIHDNAAEDVTVDDLSRVAGVSKYHFIRLFRSQFGLTPHQYVINHRVNRAREALEAGAPPSRVAQDFGFYDVSHLNRHFKRLYGLTPSRYQRQLAK